MSLFANNALVPSVVSYFVSSPVTSRNKAVILILPFMTTIVDLPRVHLIRQSFAQSPALPSLFLVLAPQYGFLPDSVHVCFFLVKSCLRSEHPRGTHATGIQYQLLFVIFLFFAVWLFKVQNTTQGIYRPVSSPVPHCGTLQKCWHREAYGTIVFQRKPNLDWSNNSYTNKLHTRAPCLSDIWAALCLPTGRFSLLSFSAPLVVIAVKHDQFWLTYSGTTTS